MDSSSTQPESALETALAGIPKKFRSRICKAYLDMKRRFNDAQYDSSWDASGLSAGKFCESVIRLLQQEIAGKATPFGKHIANFPGECKKIIDQQSQQPESLRVIIPRALVFLYTLRGKRGIGHVGGDVDANEIDAATVMRVCDWIVCELIRCYHELSLEEAQAIVDSLAERQLPDIWEVAGKKRVLRQRLNYKQKTLVLAYSEQQSGILSEDLFTWTEYSDFTTYKRHVLRQLHKDRLIEYDEESQLIYISPLGIQEVEDSILANNE
jgi:hypothetical protein